MLRWLSVLLLYATLSAVFLLALQPVGASAQILVGVAGLLVMLCIRLTGAQGYWRHLFFLIGALLILRYFYWRATTTLPSADDLANFIPGFILLAAELYCVVLLGLNLFVVARPVDRAKAPRLRPEEAPTVDVFVPSLNESRDLLAATLAAAAAMRYPAGKLNVYLLDDGGTDEKVQSADPEIAIAAGERRRTLQELCRELNVHYVTREQNVQAKAGNLTHGLARSSGELIVVFDADHAPAVEFLEETVGHFRDNERLFLVQTPHFFLNPDPIERNLDTFRTMPSENEMFYGAIQKGLDKWNAAFFCGSAAVLRRAALEEAGGFAGTSITEDCETSLELHARGWESLYVDKPMIAGLQPETFAGFIGQRSRWCRGMVQILLLKNPLFKAGLTAAQRAGYLASSLFWLFPIPRAIFLLAPLMYLFFDLEIFNASVGDFAAYTVIYLAAALIMQSYTYGRWRWPWISELYEYVQTIYLLPAVLSVFVNPRRPTFNVTAKGVTTTEDRLSHLAWPYFAVFGVLALGLVVTLGRLETDAANRQMLLIVGLWNAFNLVIAAVALGAVSERRERRNSQRMPVAIRGHLHLDAATVPVLVDDVSLGGVKLRPLSAAQGTIGLRKVGTLSFGSEEGRSLRGLPVKVVNVLTDGQQRSFGLSFERLGGADYLQLARLMYADLTPVRSARALRQRARGILAGTARMMTWAIRQSFRGAYFALARRPAASASRS